ncbi:glycosyltransferase [Candidatus Haliotispira prima]|uniref:Glycosyltransferase n=1 Tax=Candidatus Haliotispira prima TaxID=3034016 RepID=A0ABY8MEW4_9SPIO|nr:glycosyltransferase [Candidatus Haliotispira prima]
MKRLVVLHPPFYQVNYDFYHELGKLVDLDVFMFGDWPSENPAWKVRELYKPTEHSFRLRIFGKGCYPKSRIYSGCFLFELRRLRPDVVLTIAFAPYGLYAAMFQKLLGYRFYLLSNSNLESESRLSRLRRCYRSFLLSKCHKALSASPATTVYLKGLYPGLQVEEAWQTADVPYYLQQAECYAEDSQRGQLRRELATEIWQRRQGASEGPEQEPFVQDFCGSSVWLGVGRLIERKRWRWGLTLLRNYPQFRYVLVGKGEQESRLLAEAKQLGVEDRFHLLPFEPPEQLARYYNAADLLYFPPTGEPFGFVVAEALASGCPVLCSGHIGASALIKEGVNGWHGVEGPEDNGLLAPEQIEKILAALAVPNIRERCKAGIRSSTPYERVKRFCQIMGLD